MKNNPDHLPTAWVNQDRIWHQSDTLCRKSAEFHSAIARPGELVVHFQKMFEDATNRAPADYWIWDGVHPTYSGHQLMADEWVSVVRAYWPEKK